MNTNTISTNDEDPRRLMRFRDAVQRRTLLLDRRGSVDNNGATLRALRHRYRPGEVRVRRLILSAGGTIRPLGPRPTHQDRDDEQPRPGLPLVPPGRGDLEQGENFRDRRGRLG